MHKQKFSDDFGILEVVLQDSRLIILIQKSRSRELTLDLIPQLTASLAFRCHGAAVKLLNPPDKKIGKIRRERVLLAKK